MTKNRSLSVVFAATIFFSAFLLFLVQPLISKIILPWFGGSTGVWATCLVFFQAMLCLGYAYAHFIQRLPIRTQRYCHWGLLTLGAVCLPVMPGESWKPLDGNDPAYHIFLILLIKTGMPYLALSTTGPLLQAWHARIFPQARTYRFYALSNIASLSSLLLFPLWFERTMTLSGLSIFWSVFFLIFSGCCAYLAYRVSIAPPLERALPQTDDEKLEWKVAQRAPAPRHYLLWLLLPAFASFMLLAGTNHLCQDIASTPFLWILPLCLYLLSFILCFDASRWYARRFYAVLGLIGLYGVIAMRELDDSEMLGDGWLANATLPFTAPLLKSLEWYKPVSSGTSTWTEWLEGQVRQATFEIDLVGQVFLHCLALFAMFMICHGELAQRKPPPRYLTAFYLMISIGGALGSALVSFAAPLVFEGLWEWLFGLTIGVVILCGLLFQWNFLKDTHYGYRSRFLFFVLPTLIVGGIAVWQNSQVPQRFAAMLKESAPPVEGETSDPGDMSEGDEADLGSSDSVTSPSRLLTSSIATTAFVVLAAFAVLGLWGFLRRDPKATLLKWFVINATALVFAGFYLYDAFQFAPKELFEGKKESDLFSSAETNVWRGRNFYGALLIEQIEDPNFPDENKRRLQHGRITHGSQLLESPGRTRPTTYYSKSSGVGIAIDHVSEREKARIGAIGLGTGTLAAYAAPNPTSLKNAARYRLTTYEINPLVVSLSEGKDPWFTYVHDAKERGASVEIVLGDARLTLEREPDREFDVLAVDAFSGDSIPTHLLTDEAMEVYARHLRFDGILAIHISNRYLDLEPICKALANKYEFQARVIDAEEDTMEDAYTSTWVLLTKDSSLTFQLDDIFSSSRNLSPKQAILWTDACSSLYEVLLNSQYDDAIETVTSTHWYTKISASRPDIELKSVPRWWSDGWQYLRTWPVLEDANENYELRVKESRLEVRSSGDQANAWQGVE